MSLVFEQSQVVRAGQRIEAAAGGQLLGSSPSNTAMPVFPGNAPRVITTKPQVPISDQELRARIQWAHKSSPHFQVSYDRISFPEPRASTLIEDLERAYNLIFHFTHESFADRFTVYAVDQRATSLLGRSIRSHLNLEEQAFYLVENSRQRLQAELVEQLTHAMRIGRYGRHYYATDGWAMLEEAYSIFLSERLAAMPDVFPFFGADTEVIAYHIIQKNGHPLNTIWWTPVHNSTIDDLILAGAFMIYLGDTFSDDRVVTFSLCDDAITTDSFQTFFGAPLQKLEEQWLEHLPTSLLALTQEEQNDMIQRWDAAIDSRRHVQRS